MSAPTSPRDCDLAIIGGGAGGVMTAIHALRLAPAGTRIAVIEPARQLARGVAYATDRPEHLLNVPARRMSAFVDHPDDFVDFLVAREGEAARATLGASYAQRRVYRQYLEERLQQARQASTAALQVICDRVISLDDQHGDFLLGLDSGSRLRCAGVVLAVGNSPRPLPARGAAALPPGTCLEAWDFAAIQDIPAQAEVAIAGSGLSMVDTVLSLAANGHRGRIHVLSRHALLPLAHERHAVAELDSEALQAQSLRQRVRALRVAAQAAQARGLPWQAVMESTRPLVRQLWQTLSHDDQRRFLRHVVRYWDVHRHRIAAPVRAQLDQLQANGQLRLHRGRLETVARQGSRVRLSVLAPDRRALQFDVDRVINATGVEMRAQLMRNPLLSDLLGKGYARPGPHGIGLDTASDGDLVNAEGEVIPNLVVIGSLRIGRLWESLAVPELRGQTEAAARQLLHRQGLAADPAQ